MQKKLIALAVASVFAAPAFAATSNVDIFGKVGVEVSSTTNGKPSSSNATSSERNMNVDSSQNTELGMKGAEDLGGGLSATWQIAVDVRMDGVGTNFAPRNTYVGLKSKSMGEVRIGKHDTPYKSSTGKLDMFTGTVADYNSLMGTSGFTAATGTGFSTVGGVAGTDVTNFTGTSTSNTQFDARPNSLIAYISPDFGGFGFSAAYVAINEDLRDDQTGRQTKDGQAYSLAANYSNGPIFVTAAYEKQRGARSNFGSMSNNDGYGSQDDPADQKAWKLGVGLDLAGFNFNAIYERLTDNVSGCSVTFGYSGNAQGLLRDTCSHERNAWYLGAGYKMGNVKLKAAYTHMGSMDGQSNTGAKQWAVGADYSMSKRTTVYALYTKLTNDDDAAYSIGQGGTSQPTNILLNTRTAPGLTGGANVGLGDLAGGADPSAFAVGVVHTF